MYYSWTQPVLFLTQWVPTLVLFASKFFFLHLFPPFLIILKVEILAFFLKYYMACPGILLFEEVIFSNCEVSWLLPHLQANKLVCCSFIDVDKWQESPGSETKGIFYSRHSRQHEFHIPIGSVNSATHSGATWKLMQVEAVLAEFASQLRNSELRKPQYLKVLIGNLPNLYPEIKPIYLTSKDACYINIF